MWMDKKNGNFRGFDGSILSAYKWNGPNIRSVVKLMSFVYFTINKVK